MTAALPSVSRAAVMNAFNEPLAVETLPMPRELGEGEVLVRVTLAGMCGTDVHLHRGELPVPLPLVMGHETVGEVVGLGGTRSDWLGQALSTGDVVTWTAGMPCNRCVMCRVHRCPSRCPSRRSFGVTLPCDEPPHLNGGYAEYQVLRGRTAIFRLPDDLPTEAVIGAGCSLVTAVHGYERMPVGWMERVVIQGAGPVGLAAGAIAVDSGASEVIVIGGPAERLDRCVRFGATRTIDIDECPDADERRRRVLEMTDGFGADLVVECAGVPAAVAEGWRLVRDGGRVLELGQYCDCGPQPLNPHEIIRKQMTIAGAYGAEPHHWARALRFLRAKREAYPFAELVTHRFGLEDINEALDLVASWTAGKVAIQPGA